MEVIERLFLDRVDAKAARATVRGQDDLAVEATPHETQAALSLSQLTKAGTEIALNPVVIQAVPIASRDHTGISDDVHIHG